MRIFVADKTDNKMKQLTQEQLEQVYREHPEWRFDLEVGKWYKLPGNDNFLFCGTELLGDKKAYGYGWGMSGEWHDVDEKPWGLKDVIPATHKEVEAALIAEAKRRYKPADKLSMIVQDCAPDGDGRVYPPNPIFGYYESGRLWLDQKYSYCIFADGKWAAVITPENDISSDIQALKDKYPNYNWTIIAEEKQ